MFKNKKIKKLFSVICTVLTLNFTSSIFQHNPSAIQFEITKDDDGWESTSVTLDKQFYCIVVYDQETIQPETKERTWKNVPLDSLLFETDPEKNPPSINTLHVPTQHCIDKMKKFLTNTPEDAEVLIIVCLNQTSHWTELPTLPYSYMMGAQRGIARVIKNLPQNLDNTPLRHLVFSQNGTKELTTLELSEYADTKPCIRSYEITGPGKYRQTSDSVISSYEPRPAFWHLKAPGRIMSVRELKSWLGTHNPELLEQSDLKNQANRTTHTISHPPKYQKPRSNENHINPTSALHNDENEAHENSGFTPMKEYNFGLDDFDIPQVNDLMDDENYTEQIIPNKPPTYYPDIGEPESYYNGNELKTTIFSKTTKFVHKNPKTSVGIGTAVLTLGGTIMYKTKKLFTRESKQSQAKSQINQKYNQHVKNKI